MVSGMCITNQIFQEKHTVTTDVNKLIKESIHTALSLLLCKMHTQVEFNL